jgi:RHS repeat-associated protein
VRYVIQQPQQGNPTLGSAVYAGTCAASYRFGFNGKENDNEVHNAQGTSQDFEARMYDNRIGRFLSLDPQAARGPWATPYSFCDNSPILYADETGEWKEVTTTKYYRASNGNLTKKTSMRDIFRKTVKIQKEIVVHQAKFYTDFSGPGTQEIVQEKAFYIMDNIISTWQGSHSDEKHPNRPEVDISVSFADGLQVVNSLDDVNTNGPKSDDLFIWTGSRALVQQYGGDDANSVMVDPSFVIFGPSGLTTDAYNNNIPGHEFGHQGGLPDNANGLEMNNSVPTPGRINYKEARGLFRGQNGAIEGIRKELIRGFKKLTEREERKTQPK